jgi:hypothetical protein
MLLFYNLLDGSVCEKAHAPRVAVCQTDRQEVCNDLDCQTTGKGEPVNTAARASRGGGLVYAWWKEICRWRKRLWLLLRYGRSRRCFRVMWTLFEPGSCAINPSATTRSMPSALQPCRSSSFLASGKKAPYCLLARVYIIAEHFSSEDHARPGCSQRAGNDHQGRPGSARPVGRRHRARSWSRSASGVLLFWGREKRLSGRDFSERREKGMARPGDLRR